MKHNIELTTLELFSIRCLLCRQIDQIESDSKVTGSCECLDEVVSDARSVISNIDEVLL